MNARLEPPPIGESGAQLLARQMPAIKRFNPFLAEGLTLLAGKPKLGKTTIARQAMLAVTSATDFLGSKCELGNALFLSL